jgi:hypothetical protein
VSRERVVPVNVRGRVLTVRGTLLAEARRLERPNAGPTPGSLLESLAVELEAVAEELAGLAFVPSDGPDSGEPTPEELEDLIETQPIYPLPPRARPKA